METWVKSMTPGSPHKWLAARAGKFDFAGKFWMEPGAPPQAAKGVAERSLALGGRVLQEKLVSTLMGMPLEGLGLAGYDNVSGQFWSTWNDSLSTGLRVAGGTCDAAGTACVWRGSYSDPDSGKSKAVRLELQARRRRPRGPDRVRGRRRRQGGAHDGARLHPQAALSTPRPTSSGEAMIGRPIDR